MRPLITKKIDLVLCGACSIIIWKGPDLTLSGDALCPMLFGDQLRSDLVDCYMRIISSPSFQEKNDHGVWCMDTVVMV